MPIIKEWVKSPTSYHRDVEGKLSATRRFIIYGTNSIFEASNYGPQPGDFYGKYMQVEDRELTTVDSTMDYPGEAVPGTFELTVIYKGEIPSYILVGLNEIDLQFQNNATQVHIERALEQGFLDDALVTEDPGDLIGVHGDQIDGVDIFTPRTTMEISITVADLREELRRNYNSLATKINDRAFYGFLPGEVLYLTFTTERVSKNRIKVKHQFMISQNDAQIFGAQGWDYIWQTRNRVVENGSIVKNEILNNWAAKVYKSGNFFLLGVGA